MKRRIATMFSITFVSVASLSLTQTGAVSQTSIPFAELKIKTSKQEFLLGEPIRIDFQLTKKRKFQLTILGDDSVGSGYTKLYIATDDGDFKKYKFKGPVLGRQSSSRGDEYNYFDTVFFNSKPETAHLSDYGRRQAEEGMILTDYAFPKAGTYRVKATLGFWATDDSRSSFERAESNEITINVTEPEGDNRKVWEIIQSNPRIGFFMTAGQAPYRNPSIRESLLTEIDEIITAYPDSYLAGLLRDKVADNRARREKSQIERQKFDEKVKRAKDARTIKP